jgi:hypothetical protein
MQSFHPPQKLTHDGIDYEYVRDYIINDKGLRLPQRCYIYRQLNKADKGKEFPFPLSQLKWMIENPNYSSDKK